jgi:hypothetical protein
VPAHEESLIYLRELSGATSQGLPFSIPWAVFIKVRTLPRPGDFTAIVLKSYFTGEEVIAPLRYSSPYPSIVRILEDFALYQRYETYDTDPLRPVQSGFVALAVEGIPDAMIPAHLVEPADRHAHDVMEAMAV